MSTRTGFRDDGDTGSADAPPAMEVRKEEPVSTQNLGVAKKEMTTRGVFLPPITLYRGRGRAPNQNEGSDQSIRRLLYLDHCFGTGGTRMLEGQYQAGNNLTNELSLPLTVTVALPPPAPAVPPYTRRNFIPDQVNSGSDELVNRALQKWQSRVRK